MIDRRIFPDATLVTEATPASVTVPVADLLSAPHGLRDRQLLMGEIVTILGRIEDKSYVRSQKDGYHGFVATNALGPAIRPSHRVSAPATHVYSSPDIKSRERVSLSYGSLLEGITEIHGFVETTIGYIPTQHLSEADSPASDPASEALKFLGTPYLWGGNSRWGIDCSGLVQAALLACALPCPGDSDLQSQAFGAPHRTGNTRKRGDLLFWTGHVAMALGQDQIVHANAHHMQTVVENTDDALARITEPFLGIFRP